MDILNFLVEPSDPALSCPAHSWSPSLLLPSAPPALLRGSCWLVASWRRNLHAVLPGVVLAYIFGAPFAVGGHCRAPWQWRLSVGVA